MKTLIVIGHPNLSKSVVNKFWYQYLQEQLPQSQFTFRILSDTCQNGSFNIRAEQEILEQHDRIVLQFPLYWYMVPAIMKQWMDEVWCEGWAYGDGGIMMENKQIDIAVSCGAPKFVFDAPGAISLDTYMNFLLGSAAFMRAKAGSIFALYGAEPKISESTLEENTKEYFKFLTQ